jgi:hypothetical protein
MNVLIFLMMAAAANTGELNRLTAEVAASGQILEIGDTPSERVAPPVQIAPGPPPLLSFRYYDAQQRHRLSNSELMLDDAGH